MFLGGDDSGQHHRSKHLRAGGFQDGGGSRQCGPRGHDIVDQHHRPTLQASIDRQFPFEMGQPFMASQARLNWARAGLSEQPLVEGAFPTLRQGLCHQGRQVKAPGRESGGVGGNWNKEGRGRPDAACVGQMHSTLQGTCREPVLTILCSPNCAGEFVLKGSCRPDEKRPAIGKGKALPAFQDASLGGSTNPQAMGLWIHGSGLRGRSVRAGDWVDGSHSIQEAMRESV